MSFASTQPLVAFQEVYCVSFWAFMKHPYSVAESTDTFSRSFDIECHEMRAARDQYSGTNTSFLLAYLHRSVARINF